MAFRELIEKLRGKSEDKDSLSQYVKELDKKVRAEEIVMNRGKSSNQRELERDYKEFEEEKIKKQLETIRKKRQHDIDFGHNPLNAKFIMGKPEWEILKERNLFSNQGNIFNNQDNIFVHKKKRGK